MTLAWLVGLSQIADGLSWPLAFGHGSELNPLALSLFGAGGLGMLWALKALAALALALGVLAYPRRGRLFLWLGIIGYVGCLSNLVAIL